MRMHAGSSSLEGTIEGYQYPRLELIPGSFDFDANWLQIRCVIDVEGTTWAFVDPCLMTVEARALLGWLRAVASGGDPEDLGFLEPSLAFGLDDSPAGRAVVRVTFYEEWVREQGAGAPDYLILDLALTEVARAADVWESELAGYPVR